MIIRIAEAWGPSTPLVGSDALSILKHPASSQLLAYATLFLLCPRFALLMQL